MFLQRVKQEYIKNISNIISDISDEYDIYDRQTKQYINKSELLNKIIFKINSQLENTGKQKTICNGIYKNGNRCNKNAINCENYCKRHLDEIEKYKEQNNNYKQEKLIEESDIQNELLIEENEIQSNSIQFVQHNKKNIFIEDSFYLIDDKYIYDKNTYEKVGYINKEKDMDEYSYIFTQDPFLLGDIKF